MSKTAKEHEPAILFGDFPRVSKEDWKKEVEKRSSYEDLIWRTEDGIGVEPLYTEEEVRQFLPGKDTLPGEFPFARGTGKKDNSWLLAEQIRLGDPQEAARGALGAVESGADSLIFIAQTEIKSGTIKTLIKDIDPLRFSVNFALRGNPERVCRLFISSCAEEGIDTQKLGGALFFDPLSDMLARGSIATPIDENIEKIAESIGYLSDTAPGYGAFSAKGATFRNSGATITQELAFTIAAAAEYLVMLGQEGVSAEDACRHLVFSFSTGSSYFAEIAKLRAARIIWARVAEQFSSVRSETAKMRIHCHTATFNKTIYDSHVNIARATLEAMASVIGGTDSLAVAPFDAHYRKPGRFSRRVARNIQLLLRNESHLGDVADPGGGSHHLEKLTWSICEKSLELFQQVEKKGGYLECVRNGFIQDSVENSGKKALREISRGERTLVGTNEFPNLDERMAGEIEKALTEETRRLPVNAAPLAPSRAAMEFERTRLFNEKYAEKTGEAPKVFLLHLSSSPQAAARSTLSKNLLRCGGFAVADGAKNPGAEEGAAAAIAENPLAVVICGSDEDCEQISSEAIAKLKDSAPGMFIIVCVTPGDLATDLLRAGASDLIYENCDIARTFEQCLELLNGEDHEA